MTIEKDLQALSKDIKALESKVEKLLKVVGKGEKPIVAKKTVAKSVKTGAAKRAPAKKGKPGKPTATDRVLKIIKGSKKGVDTTTLMKKTGFDEKKIQNILFRTYKQRKIKRLEKGIYTGA
jgi:uncharacterized protein (DUF2147 family)